MGRRERLAGTLTQEEEEEEEEEKEKAYLVGSAMVGARSAMASELSAGTGRTPLGRSSSVARRKRERGRERERAREGRQAWVVAVQVDKIQPSVPKSLLKFF